MGLRTSPWQGSYVFETVAAEVGTIFGTVWLVGAGEELPGENMSEGTEQKSLSVPCIRNVGGTLKIPASRPVPKLLNQSEGVG